MAKNYREICQNKINKSINDQDLSDTIETSIYNYTYQKCIEKKYGTDFTDKLFKIIYKNKAMSLYLNLDKDSYVGNPNLLERITSGELDAAKLAFYTPQVIFPAHWKKYMDRQRAKDELEYAKSMGTITDEYRCGVCKKNLTSYYTLQTRSCDEPMTTFVTCLTCGNKWKFSN
jgi:transcription elongation factor S-II